MKGSAAILLIAALFSAAGTCGAQESSEPGGRSTFSPKLAATAPELDLSVSARASVDSLDEARIRRSFVGFHPAAPA
jgi:hypothetical protein